jgi:hypothetical protein
MGGVLHTDDSNKTDQTSTSTNVEEEEETQQQQGQLGGSNASIASMAEQIREQRIQGDDGSTHEDEKADGINPLYRARLAMPGRKQNVMEDAQGISNSDIVMEQLAHNGAYRRLDNTKLEKWGYREAGVVQDLESEFCVVIYMPTEEAASGDSERAKSIRAMHGGPPPPVLAFRGTDSGRALSDDMNRHGIGAYQFAANSGRIMKAFEMAGGAATVTGHSLGGALAQLAACRYPASVRNVVTFQSPGVDPGEVDKLEQYNATKKDGEKIKSTHHRAQGDVIHAGGAALTPGDVYTFESVGIGHAGDHGSFPLARLNAARGDLVEGVTNSDNKKVKDRLVRIEKSDATEEKDSWKTKGAEWARKNLGAIAKDGDMEPFVEVWNQVKEMTESGQFSMSYAKGVIDINDRLTDVQKDKMKESVELKFG